MVPLEGAKSILLEQAGEVVGEEGVQEWGVR